MKEIIYVLFIIPLTPTLHRMFFYLKYYLWFYLFLIIMLDLLMNYKYKTPINKVKKTYTILGALAFVLMLVSGFTLL